MKVVIQNLGLRMLSFHQSVRRETSFDRTSINAIDLGHYKGYNRNYIFSVYYENEFTNTKLIPPISKGYNDYDLHSKIEC
jgi:hypothetical protein